jgi:Uma2 family endonuclease
MNVAEKLAFTAQDFLDWERQQPTKREFVQGETYAMAGASDAHVTVSDNVFAALKAHLRGTPCRTHIADMKLQVESANAFFYTDVMVTCSATDAQRADAKQEPTLVVEVFHRNETNQWVLHQFGANAEIEFASVSLRLPMAAVYEDVALQRP